ncbi:MAG: endonuclease/exonuclease/phosphatase family protein [Firmicutes bacterium]|jgi:endonuclease/exonuclease/phosphatase family metal-dependent hydrolase|nr:endonuclease/exonuclease/phosphatase family protein [Bacillota bacterium]
MFKKVAKGLLVVLLLLALVGVVAYGVIYAGIPLTENPVMGMDSLAVPEHIQEEDTGIKVMSYNIRLITRESDVAHYWTNRREHMVDLIKNYDADIIGFQEVTHPQYRYLIEQLGDEYDHYGLYRSGLNRERGNIIIGDPDPEPTLLNMLRISIVDEGSPIFYRKSRFELLNYDTFWLRENPMKPGRGWDARIKRICSTVELRDHYTGRILTIYNTHFDHIGEQARQNSALLINEISEQAQGTPIVMGDFNAPEGSVVYNTLISRSLADAKYLSPADLRDSGRTYNGYGKADDDHPIDFIFTDESSFRASSYRIITDMHTGSIYISDHFPLLVELEYQ